MLAASLAGLLAAWAIGAWRGEGIAFPALLTGLTVALAASLMAAWQTRRHREALAAAQRALFAQAAQWKEAIAQRDQQLSAQRLNDPLTGLPRRALLFDRLRHRLLAGERRPEPFCLLLLDLDRFARINDALGTEAGDRVLKEVARRLLATVRECDTLARLGNDEFMLMLEGDLSLARGVASRIRQTLAEPMRHDDRLIDISASIGISAYPVHGENEVALTRHADLAMLKAKRNRSGIEIHDGQPAADVSDAQPIAAELRRAIDEGQFVLHYQPRLDLGHGGLCGIEALLRWRHPSRGELAPGEFLESAERLGLMREITRWSLGEAMRFAVRMSRAGLPLPLSVTVTGRDLEASGFIDGLAAGLLENGLSGDRLCLEIGAAAALDESEGMRAALLAVADLGVRLTVDDFGAGHAAMTRWRQLPVGSLKIRRPFVARLLEPNGGEPIVRAAIDLAREFGLRVVAEGVASLRQMRALAALGAHELQGPCVAEPMPAEALIAWAGEREAGRAAGGGETVSPGTRPSVA